MAYRLSAFRKPSGEAAYVLAGMVLINILRYAIKFTKSEVYHILTVARRMQNAEELQTGLWTHDIFACGLDGDKNYELTHISTVHGDYWAYLHQFGQFDTSHCSRCGNMIENVELAVLH